MKETGKNKTIKYAFFQVVKIVKHWKYIFNRQWFLLLVYII